MNISQFFPKKLLILTVPILIITCVYLVAKSTLFQSHPNALSIGITADLLLVLPLTYFLLIRKSDIPKTTVIPVFAVGIILASFILPAENHFYLNQFKYWVLPIIELTIFATIIYKVRTGIKKFKNGTNQSNDFHTRLRSICAEILPKRAVLPFVSEISMFYYSLIKWRKIELSPNEFTYHKSTGSQAMFGAFIFVVGIETFALHLLFVDWSPVFAWVLTGISLYTALQIFAIAKSISKRPIVITEDELLLRYGILNEVDIPLTEIQSIEYSKKEIEKAKHIKRLSPIGEMEGHNVILTVKNPLKLIGIYGLKKEFTTVVFSIDEVGEFQTLLKEKIAMLNSL